MQYRQKGLNFPARQAFVPGLVPLAAIQSAVALKPGQVTGSAWQGLAEGVRYAWKQPVVRNLLVAVGAISFFDRSYTQLMPVFARDVFHVGPQGLGLLLALPAAGTILIALFLAGGERREHHGLEVLLAAAALGLALVGFAASSSLWLSLILLVVVGAAATAASPSTPASSAGWTDRGRARSLTSWRASCSRDRDRVYCL